jgi:hypothetical protein
VCRLTQCIISEADGAGVTSAAEAAEAASSTLSLGLSMRELKLAVDDLQHQACARTTQHVLSCLGLGLPGTRPGASAPPNTLHHRLAGSVRCYDTVNVGVTQLQRTQEEEEDEDGMCDDRSATADGLIDVVGATFLAYSGSSSSASASPHLHLLCSVPRRVDKAGFQTQAGMLLAAVVHDVEGVACDDDDDDDDDDEEEEERGGDASPGVAVDLAAVEQMQWVVGGVPSEGSASNGDGAAQSTSLLLAGQCAERGAFLAKIDMRDVQFRRVAKVPDTDDERPSAALLDPLPAAAVMASVTPSATLPAALRYVHLRDVSQLEVSGQRGVAAVADSEGKVVVVDLQLASWGARY